MRPVLCLLLLVLLSFGISAGTISEFGGGTGLLLNEYHFGQMVVTPSGGPWDNISFCFSYGGICSGFGTNFHYPGSLYLLSQEYSGLPSNLASAPGLVAESTGVAQSGWIFSSSVILQPNTTYFFYEDGTGVGGVFLGDTTLGPFTGYITQGWPNLDTPFHRTQSIDYRLTGDPLPVPEPSSLSLLALLLVLLGIARWRIAHINPR